MIIGKKMESTPKRQYTIWSLIGFILMIYGVLIFAMGIYYLFSPPSIPLSYLHSSIWWGIFLFVIGFIFYWVELKKYFR